MRIAVNGMDAADGRAGPDVAGRPTGTVVIGVSGARQNAAVAGCVDGTLVAASEQERFTRVRRVGLVPGRIPTEALDAVLHIAGRRSGDIDYFVVGEDDAVLPAGLKSVRLAHHQSHAATAFCLSPFGSAAVLVCDTNPVAHTSVWAANHSLKNQDWPSSPSGLAHLYSDGAKLFGFQGREHELEALARLDSSESADDRLTHRIRYVDGMIHASPCWKSVIEDWLAEEPAGQLAHRARIAGVFQRHLGALLVALVTDLQHNLPLPALCLGGGLFYNTYFNTLIRNAGLFDDVFVAPNPGNAGLAVGIALATSGRPYERRDPAVSPFLGPGYDREVIKETLDNCKLSYECLNEGDLLGVTVEALRCGRLVAWFQGRMEWGHRGLGHRSILADPLSTYVLDNLNTYLKRRERHRAYGFSVPESDIAKFFDGHLASRFMEYDYRPLDRSLFRCGVPEGVESVRVQTVADRDPDFGRFHELHRLFGQATGVPVLVNTSFNAFAEPIVCSPRDAIRVFFGTGLDMLVMDRFVIRK